MQLFSSDPDVVVIGTKTLLIAALTEIFYSFFLVSSGIFRGAGDVRFSFLVSLIGMWGLRVGMIWMAVRVFDVGIVGVWIIIGIDCMVRMILCIVRLRSGKWLKIGINF